MLSPEHELVNVITTPEQRAAVEEYQRKASLKSDLERTDLNKDKTGAFTGAYAVNPVNGEKLPIWISDYVLSSYGTGAIMAVPAHDTRDFDFAVKFHLPIKCIIEPTAADAAAAKQDLNDILAGKVCWTGDGVSFHSANNEGLVLNGMHVKEAKAATIAWLSERGAGKRTVNYKLRDWLFSRQRYWGEPFPVIHMEDGSIRLVDEKDLPVTLPPLDDFKPAGTGESPLAKAEEWLDYTDPVTGMKGRRETNTMPQWAGSCWYYLRYIDPHNDKQFIDPEKEKYWMPVDLYVGGAEHAVLHLLYARFWHKVLYDIGAVSTPEPFHKLVNQGSEAQERRLTQMNETVANAMLNVRASLSQELAAIRDANDKALESMRNTVDEKLSTTLNTRLSESFKTVEGQLLEVHRGLGEMREMAQNVDGLRRVLTNVKTRGTFGEVQLSMILSDLLTPEQYLTNVATRPGSRERVEFAVKLPGAEEGSSVLLPIDAKFPTEDYERLQEASEKADPVMEEAARKALQTRILAEAQKIRDKYVEVPYTTEFAVLYLPAESLWSEVLKINGLVERVQRECHVTIVGPTVLAAFLNSLQMGFRTLAIEQKSAEVWRLLGEVKAEFGRFADSVESMEKRVDSVKTAVSAMRTRTNVMQRKLKGVESGQPDADGGNEQ